MVPQTNTSLESAVCATPQALTNAPLYTLDHLPACEDDDYFLPSKTKKEENLSFNDKNMMNQTALPLGTKLRTLISFGGYEILQNSSDLQLIWNVNFTVNQTR